jgi:molecular chaperone GrpE
MTHTTKTKKEQTKTSKDEISDKNKIKHLKNEIKLLNEEIKKKDDQLMRSLADYQNLIKRNEKEIQLTKNEIKKTYLSELIDIKELIIKALDDENPKDGLNLIIKNLDKFFEDENIKHIECIGKQFDHNLHHAVSTIEKNDCDDNIIIEEIKKGYIVNEKVLRPSQVIVSKKNQ